MKTFITATGRPVLLDNLNNLKTLDGKTTFAFHVTPGKLNALISNGSLSPLMPALTK